MGPASLARRDPTSARWRASEPAVEVKGLTDRVVAVQSDHLKARQRNSFAKRLAEQRQTLTRGLAALARQRFTRAADAGAAVGAFVHSARAGARSLCRSTSHACCAPYPLLTAPAWQRPAEQALAGDADRLAAGGEKAGLGQWRRTASALRATPAT